MLVPLPAAVSIKKVEQGTAIPQDSLRLGPRTRDMGGAQGSELGLGSGSWVGLQTRGSGAGKGM